MVDVGGGGWGVDGWDVGGVWVAERGGVVEFGEVEWGVDGLFFQLNLRLKLTSIRLYHRRLRRVQLSPQNFSQMRRPYIIPLRLRRHSFTAAWDGRHGGGVGGGEVGVAAGVVESFVHLGELGIAS